MTKKGKSREEIAELLDLDLSEITALALSGEATDKLSG